MVQWYLQLAVEGYFARLNISGNDSCVFVQASLVWPVKLQRRVGITKQEKGKAVVNGGVSY